MPLIAFACTACGHEFEDLLGSNDDPRRVRCPECGGRPQRQIAKFAVGASKGADAAAEPFCGRCGENRPPCAG